MRSLRGAAFLTAAAVTLALPSRADATWFGEAGLEVARHEVAVATGGARTVVWTRLRFDKTPGGFALVIPAPDGSALDVVPDAWLDALDRATAPRVFPPASVDSSCPGKEPAGFEVVGLTQHAPPLAELETLVVDDAAGVQTWAEGFGFSLAADLKTRLAETSGRFWVVRFGPHDGESVSPTLRVTLPAGTAAPIPLGLALAGAEPLDVTAWIVGKGRGALTGAGPASVDGVTLTWRAADERSDYVEQRESLLDDGSGPLAALVEAAGHDALASNTPVHDGDAIVDAALGTYFLLAEEAGALQGVSAAGCIALAAGIMQSGSPVAGVCAPADHGSAGSAEACAEDTGPGELDPSALRCGYGAASGVADDLALALAGLSPKDAWLTRFALHVPAKGLGTSFPAGTGVGGEVLPVLSATQVSFAGCQTPDGGTGSGQTGSGSGSGSGSGAGAGGSAGAGSSSGGDVYIPSDGCDCSDPGALPDPGTGEIPVSESCDCGDAGAVAGDSCDCGDGAVEVSDSCDCGDALGGVFDACGDCSIQSKGQSGLHRRRGPRVSALTFFLGCLLVPLRRWGRRKPGDGERKAALEPRRPRKMRAARNRRKVR